MCASPVNIVDKTDGRMRQSTPDSCELDVAQM